MQIIEAEEERQTELTQEMRHQSVLDQLCLMDDPMFSEALNGKLAAVQDILRTILERTDFTVVSTSTQATHNSAVGQSVRFDIEAHTSTGQVMDIEVQRVSKSSDAQRARYYSSMIDKSLLEKGDEFAKLPETWVIFLMGNDPYKTGLPLYHIDRVVKELENAEFKDGTHLIYVNGTFRNPAHPIGRLMHDFHCTRAEEMFNPLLAEELRNLKETEGGRRSMNGILQQLCEEAAEKAAREAEYKKSVQIAQEMLAEGIDPAVAAKCTKLPLAEVQELAEKKSA